MKASLQFSRLKNLLVFLFFSTQLFAQLEWESEASLPQFGKYGATTFSIGNTLYVGMGLHQDGTYSKAFWAYDLSSKTWSKKADYPGQGSLHAASFVIGNKAYVGLTGSQSNRHGEFYEYNPVNDTWTSKASFPGGNIYATVTFVEGNAGYVGLGSCGGPTCFTNKFWRYTPATNTWVQLANYPGGNAVNASAFIISGVAYVGAYRNSSSSIRNNFYKYTIATNTWSSVATMPGTPVESAISFVLYGEGYVGTGTSTSPSIPTISSNFYKYSPTNNSWTSYSSNTAFGPRFEGSAIQINDSLVIAGLGGTGSASIGILSGLYRLKLNSDTCDYYDTTFVQDTTFISDTTFINDTTFTTIYDTSIVVVQDTQTVYRLDTIDVYVIDTIYRTIFDTSYVTTFDTVTTVVYDTVTFYSYDTITRYINIAVDDTLNFNIFTDDCGNVVHKIYPNPTSDWVYLYSNSPECFEGYNVQFIGPLGQVLESKKYSSLVGFNVRGYARSLYFIRLIGDGGNTVFSKKVIID